MERSIKLIIFDLDGTLIDSRIDITRALNYSLEPYGFGSFKVENVTKMVGEGITRLVEKILGETHGNIKDDVLNRFLDYYSEHLTDYTTLFPGVRETLAILNEQKKAVISNKREHLSKKVLEQLGIGQYFDVVLGSDSVEERKPSPAPVRKVLEISGTIPEEAVMVGDSDLDIEAGKRAGVRTVGVAYGYRPIEALKDADYMIYRDLRELIPIVKRIG
ncbi:MAG: HAD-IA family hydrolase [Nitrospirota bacterium]